jgi:hypothetical protein
VVLGRFVFLERQLSSGARVCGLPHLRPRHFLLDLEHLLCDTHDEECSDLYQARGRGVLMD